MSNRQTRTSRVELVETHNLCLSLNRLWHVKPYNSLRWKRALYHALAMSSGASSEETKNIRLALNLP